MILSHPPTVCCCCAADRVNTGDITSRVNHNHNHSIQQGFINRYPISTLKIGPSEHKHQYHTWYDGRIGTCRKMLKKSIQFINSRIMHKMLRDEAKMLYVHFCHNRSTQTQSNQEWSYNRQESHHTTLQSNVGSGFLV